MHAALKSLYTTMLRSRLYEEQVQILWERGLITGEMHMSMGEEGVIAGFVDHLHESDAMALDHRGTAPLVMRGENPVLLLKEFLGHPDGLCGGQGGHMHLFSRRFLASSSGIVGASGPAAVGFMLACRKKHPPAVAVAFFGEGAMNQGMLLESMNLASVWRLPLLFVCKDNGLSITTPSEEVTGGDLLMRAQGLGLRPLSVDGPVAFLEPKLLSERHREYLCTGGRKHLALDVPASGAAGPVPRTWLPLPLGSAAVRREGGDITLISLGLGVHHCLKAAERVQDAGISAEVVDLRTLSPLDEATIIRSVARTGHRLVVDEDYQRFGLSGELAAVVLEAGLQVSYSRVCTQDTIPYARSLERAALPNPERVVKAALELLQAEDG